MTVATEDWCFGSDDHDAVDRVPTRQPRVLQPAAVELPVPVGLPVPHTDPVPSTPIGIIPDHGAASVARPIPTIVSGSVRVGVHGINRLVYTYCYSSLYSYCPLP